MLWSWWLRVSHFQDVVFQMLSFRCCLSDVVIHLLSITCGRCLLSFRQYLSFLQNIKMNCKHAFKSITVLQINSALCWRWDIQPPIKKLASSYVQVCYLTRKTSGTQHFCVLRCYAYWFVAEFICNTVILLKACLQFIFIFCKNDKYWHIKNSLVLGYGHAWSGFARTRL